MSGRTRQADVPRMGWGSLAGLLGGLVLIGLVTVTPWLFGGVLAATQVWLFVGVVIALVCWLVRLLADRSLNEALPFALVPLFCAIGLGVFQLVPLGSKVSVFLSPGGTELRSALESRESSSDAAMAANLGVAAMAERQPLSLYPASTRRDLALLVLAIGVFLLGAGLFGTPRAQIWLCGLIAVNGAAVAFFALVHRLTWSHLLYWKITLPQGGIPFGPFVNRNNAGGFLNLCLAGAVGITIWAARRDAANGSSTSGSELHGNHALPVQWRRQFLQFLSRLDALTLTFLCLAICIAAAIFCSLSRGATIAMTGAAIVTIFVVLSARRRSVQAWSSAVIVTAGLALVCWIGMLDTVHARLATLLDREVLWQSRIATWQAAFRAMPDFWQVGGGLGTYRFVYSPYEQTYYGSCFYHAENQYIEAIVVGGVFGLGLILIMLGLVGTALWRLLRDDPDPRAFAFGIAGSFALTSQAIHALFDFGLYIPSNVLLFALLCGAISGRAAQLTTKRFGARFLALPRARVVPLSAATLLLLASIWGWAETERVAAMETALRETRFEDAPTGTSPEALLHGVEQLASVMEYQADDAEGHLRMAELLIHLYRVRALEQLCSETGDSADDPNLWQATSPTVVHARAHEFAEENLVADLERLRSEPVIKDHLVGALRHLVLARRCCALLPEVHLTMAQLSSLVEDPNNDRIHIERAQRLAPVNPHLLFRCGVLDFNAGRCNSAYDSWQRSLALSPEYIDDVLHIVVDELKSPEVISKLLPDSPELLVQLARKQYGAEEQADIRGLLLQRAEGLLERADLPEDERQYLLGSIFALEDACPEAIQSYSRAVELRPHELVWRYELALLLQREGLLDEALKHARLCARGAPRSKKYRALLERIYEETEVHASLGQTGSVAEGKMK